ncbi:MAG: Hcp family type VI secretion system effector [Candidatus Eisenbacteria bacterium]|uniref:Hcp family type VI secretion system effector n=1 Tax=Eiseniibacteriota bacterium TaxID=2212470 RepID=A0A948W812_UNCEI|nr:Hcp family type VI secretion system effector [Candidatus Eisenbacteria bacterium]MBU1948375.1 Hcp family type VI secretion system effector [Candidatus Eisenbacteria bacterium]MBU2692830.1 Hcp family type VI secretion system effector [Candidatus Eisenbacteria bacterium]
MPMPIHLTIEGMTQGAFEGPVKMKGREGTVLVQALVHEVLMPRSPQTGLSTGKRMHNPLVVTKELDKISPQLYLALVTGEHLTVTLKWYRPNPEGGASEQHYFTTTLTNAVLVSIKEYIPNVLDARNNNFTHMEDVSFTYEKIVWTFVPDGVESEDDWQSPVE